MNIKIIFVMLVVAFSSAAFGASSTLNNLPSANLPLDGTELYYTVQSGTDRKVTGAQSSNVTFVSNIATLRTKNYSQTDIFINGYRTNNDGGQGNLILIPNDSTTADDGACVFVDSGGHRFFRSSCSSGLTSQQSGAYGDRVEIASSGVTIANGFPNLEVIGASFATTDVGKTIVIAGAGAAGFNLQSTIQSVTNQTHVILSSNALTSLAGATANISYGHNDAAFLSSGLAVASSRQIPFDIGSVGYMLTAGITVENSSTRLIASGATIDFSGSSVIAGVKALTFDEKATTISSQSDSKTTSLSNNGFIIVCSLNGGPLGLQDGIGFSGNGVSGASAITIRDFSIWGCQRGVNLSDANLSPGSSGLTDTAIENAFIQNCAYGVYAPSSQTQASEKVTISNSFIVNNSVAGIYLDTPLIHMHVGQTSVDGSTNNLLYSNGSEIVFDNGHMEAVGASGYVANAIGAGAKIIISNTGIFIGGPHANPIFNSAGTAASIILSNTELTTNGAGFTGDTVEAAGGRFVVDNYVPQEQGTSPLIPFAEGNNRVNNGHFTSADINGWLTTGTVAYDGTVGHTALGSIKLSPSPGSGNASASYNFPCAASQYAAVQFYGQTSGMAAAGGSFLIKLIYLDTGGNAIRNDSTTFSSDLASFTQERLGTNIASVGWIPTGTVSCQVQIFANQAGGGFTVWADDIYVFSSSGGSLQQNIFQNSIQLPDSAAWSSTGVSKIALTGSSIPTNGFYLPSANTVGFVINSADWGKLQTAAGFSIFTIGSATAGNTLGWITLGNSGNDILQGGGFLNLLTGNVSTNNTSADNINLTGGSASGTGASNGGSIVLTPGLSTNAAAGTVQVIGGTSLTGQLTATNNIATAVAFLNTSAKPSIATCGTNPSVITGSNNQGGQFVFGSGSVTSCAVSFANAFPNFAWCVLGAANATASNVLSVTNISASPITGMNIASSANSGGAKFNYNCQGS